MIRPSHPRLVLAGCLIALVGAVGCKKAPAPQFRVINESELKVKVKGGEEIVAAASSAPAAPAETPVSEKTDGDSK